MFSSLINPCIIALSFVTAFGVFVHDTKIDKASYSILNAALMRSNANGLVIKSNPFGSDSSSGAMKDLNLHPDLHPHAEKGGMAARESRIVRGDGTGHLLQPRAREDRQHMRAHRAH